MSQAGGVRFNTKKCEKLEKVWVEGLNVPAAWCMDRCIVVGRKPYSQCFILDAACVPHGAQGPGPGRAVLADPHQ